MHHERRQDRSEHADDSVAGSDREQHREAGETQHRQHVEQPADHHEQHALPWRDQRTAETYERLVADKEQARREAGDGEERDQAHRERRGRERLADEQVPAPAGARQHRLPGAVTVLGGEDVTREDTREHRESP